MGVENVQRVTTVCALLGNHGGCKRRALCWRVRGLATARHDVGKWSGGGVVGTHVQHAAEACERRNHERQPNNWGAELSVI